MTFPGPAALGRGLIVTLGAGARAGHDAGGQAGDAVTASLAAAHDRWERVTVDEGLLGPEFGGGESGGEGSESGAGGKPGGGGDKPGDGGERLADTVDRLHRAWAGRRPVIVELGLPAEALRQLRMPVVEERPPYLLGPEFTLLSERLQFLLWRNNYDARNGDPVWWWARKAAALGAEVGGQADVVLRDGAEAWVDGGPRHPLDLPVVHAESVELGRLALQPPPGASSDSGALAPDQRAAVEHRSGPVRVVAPAGSGKTRTLNARLLHLVDDRGVESSILTAVAYNNRAAAEMRGRLGRSDLQIRTIHSLGWAIVRDVRPNADLLGERDVRNRLRRIVPHTKRAGTDVFAPYIEALSDVRIALRDPETVEAERNDVPGFAQVFEAYRAGLGDRDECDHDEQVYEAIRLLLADTDLRARWQRRCRHLLVDEFQDLTPAYLLLLRLLASPALDVFGVGDDDQTIYGYAGADPRFLLEYDRFFPGAGAAALEVSYRCPPDVVTAAGHLLVHNQRRLPKVVRAASERRPDGFRIVRLPEERMATEAAAVVASWRADGVADADIAVLARVNSMLLPPLAALDDAGVAARCSLGPSLMYRTLVRATLAWMRLALQPDSLQPDDLLEAVRRPARRINRVANERLLGRGAVSLERLAALGKDLKERQGEAWANFVTDIAAASRVAADGDARALLDFLMQQVGLGRAAGTLDSGRTRPDRAAHAHDLVALRRTAAVYSDPAGFQERLWNLLRHTSEDAGGVTLTTIHRVKGLEWDRVLVFGADEGLLPHHLCEDIEEERRVIHVAITRGSSQVVVLADEQQPSRFLYELEGHPPPAPKRQQVDASKRRATDPSKQPDADEEPYDESLFESLRQWRLEESRRLGVRAFIVFPNRTLKSIARRKPRNEWDLTATSGVGPAKLAAYGEAVLEVVRTHRAGAQQPPT